MRRWCDNPPRRTAPGRGLLFVGVLLFFFSGPALATDGFTALTEAVNSWHTEDAQRILESMSETQMRRPRVQYQLGRLHVLKGEYTEAVAAFNRAMETKKAKMDWKHSRDMAMSLRVVVGAMAQVTGPSGQVAFRLENPRDAILVPYADEALIAQRERSAEHFGTFGNWPLEVIVLSEVDTFSRVTGLTPEQVERTGTVAVTKYGRIFLLSPAKLAYGYPWLDTLAHELNHVAIIWNAGANVPIWLHEGVAKMFECLWRDKPLQHLTPQEAYLLDRASREGRLIPLSRFHPSVAYLSSQEDAALAYAQVLSFLTYVGERQEAGWTRRMLATLSSASSIDNAFLEMTGTDLKKMYRWWKQAISGKRQTPIPAVQLMKRRFRHGKTADEVVESELDSDVRRFIRLGDLLRGRGHQQAALVEYEKARAAVGSPVPAIVDRMAGLMIESGDDAGAAKVLPEIVELYPHHSTAFVQLGLAFSRLNKKDKAINYLERAVGLNPFNPEVHCTLAALYSSSGMDAQADTERAHCRTLLGSGP